MDAHADFFLLVFISVPFLHLIYIIHKIENKWYERDIYAPSVRHLYDVYVGQLIWRSPLDEEIVSKKRQWAENFW